MMQSADYTPSSDSPAPHLKTTHGPSRFRAAIMPGRWFLGALVSPDEWGKSTGTSDASVLFSYSASIDAALLNAGDLSFFTAMPGAID
jgi:hypothetical protein